MNNGMVFMNSIWNKIIQKKNTEIKKDLSTLLQNEMNLLMFANISNDCYIWDIHKPKNKDM